MANNYRVIIEDELSAESPWAALRSTVERIQSEETVASVECLKTGEVIHYEITTGERLDFEGEDDMDIPIAPI